MNTATEVPEVVLDLPPADHLPQEEVESNEDDTSPLLPKEPSDSTKKLNLCERLLIGFSLTLLGLFAIACLAAAIYFRYFRVDLPTDIYHPNNPHNSSNSQNQYILDLAKQCRETQYHPLNVTTTNGTSFIVPANASWLWVNGHGRSPFRSFPYDPIGHRNNNSISRKLPGQPVSYPLVKIDDEVLQKVITWSITNAAAMDCSYEWRDLHQYFYQNMSTPYSNSLSRQKRPEWLKTSWITNIYNFDFLQYATEVEVLQLWYAAMELGLVPLQYLTITAPQFHYNQRTLRFLDWFIPHAITERVPMFRKALDILQTGQEFVDFGRGRPGDPSRRKDFESRQSLRVKFSQVMNYMVHTLSFPTDATIRVAADVTQWERDFVGQEDTFILAAVAKDLGLQRLYDLARLRIVEEWEGEQAGHKARVGSIDSVNNK